MTLRHARIGEEHHVYLPSGSVYCLTGKARWDWSHGIEGRTVDVVQDKQGRRTRLMRELRVSVTFRWMTEGADELVELAS
jgi:alkylated DNA repair dioxygenase AlkB